MKKKTKYVRVPRTYKPEGAPREQLVYANPQELSVLEFLRGAPAREAYGIPSYPPISASGSGPSVGPGTNRTSTSTSNVNTGSNPGARSPTNPGGSTGLSGPTKSTGATTTGGNQSRDSTAKSGGSNPVGNTGGGNAPGAQGATGARGPLGGDGKAKSNFGGALNVGANPQAGIYGRDPGAQQSPTGPRGPLGPDGRPKTNASAAPAATAQSPFSNKYRDPNKTQPYSEAATRSVADLTGLARRIQEQHQREVSLAAVVQDRYGLKSPTTIADKLTGNMARTAVGESLPNAPINDMAAAARVMQNRLDLWNDQNVNRYSPANLFKEFDATGLRPETKDKVTSTYKDAVLGSKSYGRGLQAVADAMSVSSDFSKTAPSTVLDATHYLNEDATSKKGKLKAGLTPDTPRTKYGPHSFYNPLDEFSVADVRTSRQNTLKAPATAPTTQIAEPKKSPLALPKVAVSPPSRPKIQKPATTAPGPVPTLRDTLPTEYAGDPLYNPDFMAPFNKHLDKVAKASLKEANLGIFELGKLAMNIPKPSTPKEMEAYRRDPKMNIDGKLVDISDTMFGDPIQVAETKKPTDSQTPKQTTLLDPSWSEPRTPPSTFKGPGQPSYNTPSPPAQVAGRSTVNPTEAYRSKQLAEQLGQRRLDLDTIAKNLTQRARTLQAMRSGKLNSARLNKDRIDDLPAAAKPDPLLERSRIETHANMNTSRLTKDRLDELEADRSEMNVARAMAEMAKVAAANPGVTSPLNMQRGPTVGVAPPSPMIANPPIPRPAPRPLIANPPIPQRSPYKRGTPTYYSNQDVPKNNITVDPVENLTVARNPFDTQRRPLDYAKSLETRRADAAQRALDSNAGMRTLADPDWGDAASDLAGTGKPSPKTVNTVEKELGDPQVITTLGVKPATDKKSFLSRVVSDLRRNNAEGKQTAGYFLDRIARAENVQAEISPLDPNAEIMAFLAQILGVTPQQIVL